MWVSALCMVAASADLLLNEVFYDPPGADAGHEFVELLNPMDLSVALDGVVLLFLNDGDPLSARELWRAAPGSRLDARSYLVLGEEFVAQRDLTLVLGIQNGPDALWLLRDGERIDAVAWGEVSTPAEGNAAPDPSGRSVGRVPDGVDVDDNALDFKALEMPTPGAPNSFATQLAITDFSLDPPWLESAAPQQLRLLAVAVGDAPVQSSELVVLVDGVPVDRARWVVAAGDTLRHQAEWNVAVGTHFWRVEFADAAATALERPFQIGLGVIALNELMVRPSTGRPEWIELRCASPPLCAGTRHGFSDRGGTIHVFEIPTDSMDEFIVVAEDCGVLRAEDPQLRCVEADGSWPGLNDRAGADGIADVVNVHDAAGMIVDRLAYGAEGALERDRSLEAVRHGAHRRWYASPVKPTPGRPNATQGEAVPGEGLRLSANPWSGEVALLHVFLDRVPAGSRVEAEIRDLRGRLVRLLGHGGAAGELRQWIWDGRDSAGRRPAPGAYVVIARIEAAGAVQTHRVLLALGVLR